MANARRYLNDPNHPCNATFCYRNVPGMDRHGNRRYGLLAGRGEDVTPKPKKLSQWEEMLAQQLRAAGLVPTREYRLFAELVGTGDGLRQRLKDAGMRDFRFDFAFLDHKLLIEVDGATYSGGRHVTGTGYEADCTKLNQAILCGFRVLKFTSTSILSGVALQCIEAALATKWTQSWVVEA